MSRAQISSGTQDGGGSRPETAAPVQGIAILDREGRWLEADPAIERLLGRTIARLAGEPLIAAVAARDADALRVALQAALVAGDAQSQRLQLALLHDDGHEIHASVGITPMHGAGGGVRSLVLQVVAGRGAGGEHADAEGDADADADALSQRLAEAEAALASLNHLQASFAHGVSHDLRAPLRAVDSFSALLATHLDGNLDATARDYIARIRAASARMANLIDSLLELSRAMRAELHPAPVDLGLLVDWAHAELADAEPGRAAQIDVQPGLQVLGDERQLRQLVNQLLHNAWKFSRDRDRVRVEIDGEPRGDHVIVRVRDHGSGFDMRYAGKLFEPFQRLHGAEEASGNGIGLAIVRCIAQRHGGRAWAQSEPGTGSTFFIELPAVPDNGTQA